MNFASIEYLFFLPIVFLGYWLLCPTMQAKNWWVVCASYFFYSWWDWRFTLLLALTSALSYGGGLLEHRWREKRQWAKAVMWTCIAINLSILGTFKYYDFFAESTIRLFALLGFSPPSLPLLAIILPVGISFYTFQALSYVIDVYRGKLAPTRDAVAFFAYLSFFPQLVAGPIERATHLLPQFYRQRTFNYSAATDGLRQILWGLVKKVVVADGCAAIVDGAYANPAADGTDLWAATIFFAFQIYADFSGYSDIAIGTARLFGIELMQNFRTPYFARSVADFWRRWHISLMTWLRDYVYIPLGGSRCGKIRRVANTLVVFLASGLWHGAAWTFVGWGLYHALWFVPGILRTKQFSSSPVAFVTKALQGLRTFLIVTLGWVLFRSESLSAALEHYGRMFTDLHLHVPYGGRTAWIAPLLMLVTEWFMRRHSHALAWNGKGLSACIVCRWACYYALVMLLLYYGSRPQVPFIYFQF